MTPHRTVQAVCADVWMPHFWRLAVEVASNRDHTAGVATRSLLQAKQTEAVNIYMHCSAQGVRESDVEAGKRQILWSGMLPKWAISLGRSFAAC